MKKSQIERILKSKGIDYQIFGNQRDKTKTSYEIKLIKDKYTSLRTNIDYKCTEDQLNEIIEEFKKFDYRQYAKKLFNI